MVHGGDHGDNGSAVGEGQYADLRTGEELLYHDLPAGVAEGPVFHDGLYGGFRFFQILGNQNALAQGQTVGLDHDGEGGGAQIGKRLGRIVKDLIGGGGNVILVHQVLGKDLAALNPGGLGVGTEAGNSRLMEPVHTAQGQRIVGRDYGEVHGVGFGKVHNGVDVLGTDLGNAHGVGSDAAVAGQSVDGLHSGIFPQFFDNGVFAASAADYQ